MAVSSRSGGVDDLSGHSGRCAGRLGRTVFVDSRAEKVGTRDGQEDTNDQYEPSVDEVKPLSSRVCVVENQWSLCDVWGGDARRLTRPAYRHVGPSHGPWTKIGAGPLLHEFDDVEHRQVQRQHHRTDHKAHHGDHHGFDHRSERVDRSLDLELVELAHAGE